MRNDWPFAEQMMKLRPPESRATGRGAAVPGGESESSDSNLDQLRSTFDSDSDSSSVVDSNPISPLTSTPTRPESSTTRGSRPLQVRIRTRGTMGPEKRIRIESQLVRAGPDRG